MSCQFLLITHWGVLAEAPLGDGPWECTYHSQAAQGPLVPRPGEELDCNNHPCPRWVWHKQRVASANCFGPWIHSGCTTHWCKGSFWASFLASGEMVRAAALLLGVWAGLWVTHLPQELYFSFASASGVGHGWQLSRQVLRAVSCFGWQNCPSHFLALPGQCYWGWETGDGRGCSHAQGGWLMPCGPPACCWLLTHPWGGQKFCKCAGASR